MPPGRTALALLVSHLSIADLQLELARYPGPRCVESDLPPAVISAVQEALNEANRPRFTDAAPASRHSRRSPGRPDARASR